MSNGHINTQSTLPEIKQIIFDLLKRAASDTKSAFRFITLATIDKDIPNLRTVVLRKFDEEERILSIYTDYRSNKIEELTSNNKATILAYDKGHRTQIKLIGEAHVHHQNDMVLRHWKQMQGGKEAYNTTKAPGSEVKSLERAHTFKKDFD